MTTTTTKKKDDKKPRGYFKYVLALDCETSGVAMGCDDPSFNPDTGKTYASVSWGFLVLDGATLKEVDHLYLEIKPTEGCAWDTGAEKVHGLSREYLAKHGTDEDKAVLQIAQLILKYWGPDSYINLLGHNVQFDKWFLQRLMRSQGIELNFSNRLIDTNSFGFLIDVYNSDDLFSSLGLKERNEHNAMEDIRITAEAARIMRKLVQSSF